MSFQSIIKPFRVSIKAIFPNAAGRRRRVVLGSCVLVLLLASASAFCEDWPRFRGPRCNGKSLETGLLKKWPSGGPKLLWMVQGLGKGHSQAVVANERVYVSGMVEKIGYVSAFDLAGEPKWKKPYGEEWTKAYPGSRCTPTVDKGFIYIITSLGELVCMDANTGEKEWHFNVFEKFKGGTGRFGLIESLLIDKEKVICTVGGPDATIVAVDKKTGAIVWKTVGLKDKAAYCSPLLIEHGGKRLIVTMTSHHVIGVAADSGKLMWKYPCKNPYGQNPNTPVYADGMLFCTSGDKIGSFMLKLSGSGKKVKHQWWEPKLDCHHGNVVEINGYLYGSAHQNSDGWVCLELSSGKVMFETKAMAKGSACYADGMLYCYGVDGSVSLVKPSPKDFALISSFTVKAGNGEHFAQPVISGGRLYIRRGDALMVYNISCLSETEK